MSTYTKKKTKKDTINSDKYRIEYIRVALIYVRINSCHFLSFSLSYYFFPLWARACVRNEVTK